MAKASDNLFPKLLLVEGATPATPAASNQGLFIDSADHKLKRVDSTGTVTTVEGGGSGGSSGSGIVGRKSYNPGTFASYTTTSATAVDIDATNLVVTFTAPTSGEVEVALEMLGGVAGTGYMMWCLRSGTTKVTGSDVQLTSTTSAGANARLGARIFITGLTSGQSYTWKWAYYDGSGGAQTCRGYAGGVTGPAVMKVTAVPSGL